MILVFGGMSFLIFLALTFILLLINQSYIQKDVNNDLNKLTEIINPFMMLVLGGVVGILILSLILPMFTMLNTL